MVKIYIAVRTFGNFKRSGPPKFCLLFVQNTVNLLNFCMLLWEFRTRIEINIFYKSSPLSRLNLLNLVSFCYFITKFEILKLLRILAELNADATLSKVVCHIIFFVSISLPLTKTR